MKLTIISPIAFIFGIFMLFTAPFNSTYVIESFILGGLFVFFSTLSI